MGAAGPRLSLLARRRGLVPRLASTGYVVATAFRADEGHGPRVWALGATALGLAALSSRDERELSAWALWAASLVVASLASATGGDWLDAFGVVGLLVACVSASLALARMGAAGTRSALVPKRAASPAMSAVGAALPLGLCLAVTVGSALGRGYWLEPRAVAAVTSAWAGLALVLASAEVFRTRRLVMGVADRAGVLRSMAGTLVALTAVAALVRAGAVDRVLRLGLAAEAVLLSYVALHGDAVRITQVWRRTVVLVTFGGPLVMLGAIAVEGTAGEAPTALLVVGAAALGVGTVAHLLERPLRPAEGAWIDAIDEARRALLGAEPDAALRQALVALRAPGGPSAAPPELWTLEPTRVLTVDAAGYTRERESELPSDVLAVAAAEPEGTLRAEVLSALEVRRPDLRHLMRWMDDRAALCATVIAAEGETKGLLVLPRGSRSAPLALEEARALKRLADSFGGACEARAALERSRQREREALVRAEAAEDRVLRLEQAEARNAGRHVLAATRAARPATVGVYSAASRLALDAIERRMHVGAPIAVVAASGVDPVPYLARAHLGGPRRSGPFVVVDGTSSREHDLSRWSDPLASPLALADRGFLVLLDGAALPADVQRLIAQALAERRAPWERPEPLDIALAVSTVEPPSSLVAAGRLEQSLAARLADALEAPVALPRLRDRAEDIRAIVTDRLAREGLRVRGRPLGIEDAAFARLADYGFPGEDAELGAIVQRLVARAAGNVVRAADVEALALRPEPAPALGGRGPRAVHEEGG